MLPSFRMKNTLPGLLDQTRLPAPAQHLRGLACCHCDAPDTPGQQAHVGRPSLSGSL